MPGTPRTGSLPGGRRGLLVAAYLLLFLALDWVSFIRPQQDLNITPWNPQPALAVALLLWDRRWLWLVWCSLVVTEFVVRGTPPDLVAMLLACAALTLSYAALAQALRQRLDPSQLLATRAQLTWLMAIVTAGALVNALVYVLSYVAAGQVPAAVWPVAAARYWVGDLVGLLVWLPLLLMLGDQGHRAALAAALRDRVGWLAAAATLLLLWAVFGRDDRDLFKFFYLLLLPVVWAASRLGLPGAVLTAGLAQLGVVVAVQTLHHADLTVFELQVLLAVLTMTALQLGVAVDERSRTAAQLVGSLRLAAAGQMSAALAHELSQPLTALGSYAQAARLVAAQPEAAAGERERRLLDIAQRMADGAEHAGVVVKRLRDFFRSGSTALQPVPPQALLDDALHAQQRRADLQRVQLQLQCEPALPSVWVDPVQIGVVLRNLVGNALDAVAGQADARVQLLARRDGERLRIEVQDNGPGVPRDRLAAMFEPGPSVKPGGMGVGLSICRAIVEAHGGRLWAEPGPGGRLCLTLALDTPDPSAAADAP